MPKKDRYGTIQAFVYEIGGTTKVIKGDVSVDGERNLIHVYYKKVGSTKHTRKTFHVGTHMDNQLVHWQAGRAADKAYVEFKDFTPVRMVEISSFDSVSQNAGFLSIVDIKGNEFTYDLRHYFVNYETTWRNDALMWEERGEEPPKVVVDRRRATGQIANTVRTGGNFKRRTSRK